MSLGKNFDISSRFHFVIQNVTELLMKSRLWPRRVGVQAYLLTFNHHCESKNFDVTTDHFYQTHGLNLHIYEIVRLNVKTTWKNNQHMIFPYGWISNFLFLQYVSIFEYIQCVWVLMFQMVQKDVQTFTQLIKHANIPTLLQS